MTRHIITVQLGSIAIDERLVVVQVEEVDQETAFAIAKSKARTALEDRFGVNAPILSKTLYIVGHKEEQV